MIHGYDKRKGNKYYFIKYKDFLKALEQAETDNKFTKKYEYSSGAECDDNLQDYFYIVIHK